MQNLCWKYVCIFNVLLNVIFLYCLYKIVAKCALLGQGLYIQSKCSTIKNTICDVLDGYYCKDYSNSQCLHALKHSVCAPGQETKSPGIVSEYFKISFFFYIIMIQYLKKWYIQS